MLTFVCMVTAISFCFSIILLVNFLKLSIKNKEYVYSFLIGSLCFFAASCFGYDLANNIWKREQAKPVVVSTKIPPQIDTVVTHSKNTTDTVFVYHFTKKLK